jgi:hypothetical protein
MKELFTDPEFLKSFIPTTISLIVTGLASLVIGVYLEKFKGRITTLSRKISSQAIASASEDEYWGHIKVLYNNYEATNLNFFTIEIKNESSRDVSNVIVDLKVDNDSMILASNGYLNDSNTYLLLTNEYFQYYVDVTKRNDEELKQVDLGKLKETDKDPTLARELKYVTTLKKYVIPVLNRDKKSTFNILVENFKGIYPTVNADIVQEGIRLVDFEDENDRNKKVLLYSLGIGIVVFIALFWLIIKSFPDATRAIILTGVLGLTYSLIGMIFFFIVRYIKKLLN